MELPINKDPNELNKSAFAGFKWWQYACIIGAVAIAVIFTLCFSKKFGTTINSIICALLVLPLGYIGVFKKNGLDFFEYYKNRRRKCRVFTYISDPIKPKNDTKKKHTTD